MKEKEGVYIVTWKIGRWSWSWKQKAKGLNSRNEVLIESKRAIACKKIFKKCIFTRPVLRAGRNKTTSWAIGLRSKTSESHIGIPWRLTWNEVLSVKNSDWSNDKDSNWQNGTR